MNVDKHHPYTENVAREYALQARCTCGWRGPVRDLYDRGSVVFGLLNDDHDWHTEMVAGA